MYLKWSSTLEAVGPTEDHMPIGMDHGLNGDLRPGAGGASIMAVAVGRPFESLSRLCRQLAIPT